MAVVYQSNAVPTAVKGTAVVAFWQYVTGPCGTGAGPQQFVGGAKVVSFVAWQPVASVTKMVYKIPGVSPVKIPVGFVILPGLSVYVNGALPFKMLVASIEAVALVQVAAVELK